jgi:hypothetical protein
MRRREFRIQLRSGESPRTADYNRAPMPEPLPSGDVLLPDPRRRRLVFAVCLAGLLVYGAFDVIPRAARATTPSKGTDLAVYLAAARAVAAGQSPYDASTPMAWPYIYPPAFAILLVPIAHLPPVVPALGFFIATLLALAGGYAEMVRLSSRLGLATGTVAPVSLVRASALSAIVIGVSPALQCLRQGQVAVFLLWLCLWALRRLLSGDQRHAIGAGLAFSIAVAIKLTPILPAIAVIAVLGTAGHRRREIQRAAAVGLGMGLVLFFAVLPLAATGPVRLVADLHDFAARVIANRELGRLVTPFWGNSSAVPLAEWIAGTVAGVIDTDWRGLWAGTAPLVPEGGGLITTAGVIAGAAVVSLLAWSCRRLAVAGDDLSVSVSLGLALTAMILAQPLTWSHMLVLACPAVILAPAWLWRAGRTRAAWWVALWPAAFVAMHYAFKLADARALGWRGPYLLAWYAGTALVVARSYDSPADRVAAADFVRLL